MLGQQVEHVRFGAGRVTAFAPPRIGITFGDGTVRTFAYPQAVGRFLHFADDQAQRLAEQAREQSDVLAAEDAMARLLVNRRRAEEMARARVEAAREKRAASARRSAAARRVKNAVK